MRLRRCAAGKNAFFCKTVFMSGKSIDIFYCAMKKAVKKRQKRWLPNSVADKIEPEILQTFITLSIQLHDSWLIRILFSQ